MKNQINETPDNTIGDASESTERSGAARREAFDEAHAAQLDESAAPEIHPAVRDKNQAPQGLDADPPKGGSRLWIIVALLVVILIVVAIGLTMTIINGNRKDAIDVGAADKKDARQQQYRQTDETLKTAFANTNATNPTTQPTPPSGGNMNSGTAGNPNPFPPTDWDKIPNPPPPPTGNVGDELAGGKNGTSTVSGDNGGKSGGTPGGASGNSGSPASRPNQVAPTNAQVLEVPTSGERPSYNSGGAGSARNNQSSIYYYARNEDGAPTLNRLTSAPDYVLSQKPRFNDIFPVRLLGALHTLGSGGLARMVLTRAVEGDGYSLPKGTFFIGRVSGGEGNRLFIALIGYIDPQTQGLVALGGDVNGIDGGLGIKGQRKHLDNRFKKFFGEALKTSRELGVAYLLGRRGGGGNWNSGLDTRLQTLSNPDANQSREFVLVESGQEGYIIVNDLPPAIEKPNTPLPDQPYLPGNINLPVDSSIVSENDLNALSGFGEKQLKQLLSLSAEERERALQKYSPQVQAILREALK